MRRRVTFVQRPENAVDPAQLSVDGLTLIGPDLVAIKEERLSLALEELPPELSRILEETRELHVRWISSLSHETVDPLNSRLPPGFHVFYTPQRDGSRELRELCTDLQEVFGELNCMSSESFTKLPNDRFSHSAAFHYYQQLEDTSPLIKFVTAKLCSSSDSDCISRVEQLGSATSIDVSYDTISHALKATAWWPHLAQPLSITSTSNHRTEVGILTTHSPPNLEPHELGLTGFLTVLGEHKEPSPAIFSIPSRHRRLNSSFWIKFLQPTGLHPTLQLAISASHPPAEDAYCAIHAYFTLPKHTFADRYQLEDALFLASKNLTALRYMSTPVDLEAPAYKVDTWGSSVLLELSPPKLDGPWTAGIPLHFRYMEPTASGFADVEMPYPAVFWACTSEEGTKFPNNPFERVNLGYDALFGPRTVFWHVNPQPEFGNRLTVSARIPVLETKHAELIIPGTIAAVLIGLTWIFWESVRVYIYNGYQRGLQAPVKQRSTDGKETPQKSKRH